MTQKIAIIGLGSMGFGMAKSIWRRAIMPMALM